MKTSSPILHESHPDTHHCIYSKTVFGFWIYLLTDFVLFGALFATYAVLRNSTYGGPSAAELFHLPFALMQTITLLVSSFTIGLAGAAAHRKEVKTTLALLAVTLLLGISFMGMELADFKQLIASGNGWQRSAFLSMFFTLVGTHGIHILFGLLWILVLGIPIWRHGITTVDIRRVTCLKMFWQFLNIVWIFVFSFVYLMGVK